MPFEIQSKLREDVSVLKDMPSSWRVEFINTTLDPGEAVHISVQFVGQKINREYGEKIVAAMLDAINRTEAA